MAGVYECLQLGLTLDLANDSVWGILLYDVSLVEHVELFSSVSASIEQNGLLATWVISKEVGYIQNLAIDNDPAVILLVVLGNFFPSVHLVGIRLGSTSSSRSRG